MSRSRANAGMSRTTFAAIYGTWCMSPSPLCGEMVGRAAFNRKTQYKINIFPPKVVPRPDCLREFPEGHLSAIWGRALASYTGLVSIVFISIVRRGVRLYSAELLRIIACLLRMERRVAAHNAAHNFAHNQNKVDGQFANSANAPFIMKSAQDCAAHNNPEFVPNLQKDAGR